MDSSDTVNHINEADVEKHKISPDEEKPAAVPDEKASKKSEKAAPSEEPSKENFFSLFYFAKKRSKVILFLAAVTSVV